VRTSSFGCMIFDSLIAVWFLAGAPSPMRTPEPRSSEDMQMTDVTGRS
jgi:hypothetical protein